MSQSFRKKVIILLLVLLLVEVLSFLAFSFPLSAKVIFITLSLFTLVISIYRLEYGLLVVLTELFIGSQGYLFYWQSGDFKLSIRLVIWSLLMLVFLVKSIYQLIKLKEKSPYLLRLKKFVFWRPFIYLSVFIILGAVTAYFYQNKLITVFLDFNAWLYFLLLFPLIAVYNRQDRQPRERLKLIFWAATLWLGIETLVLLFIFTHNLGINSQVYLWLRKTLVGEVTPTVTGWPRIFIQSEIFPLIAFFFLLWYSQLKLKLTKFFDYRNLAILMIAGFFFSTIIISFSRSFWLGTILTMVISLFIIGRKYSVQRMLRALAWLSGSIVIGVIITYLVAIIPISQPENVRPNFLNRVTNEHEAAVVSRWSLLKPLSQKIMSEPIFGHGFGATITYISSDPRVLANHPQGQYTSYAFEWGYLDIWLKIGIFGLLAYLFLLFSLFRVSLTRGLKNNDYLLLGLSTAILFLAIIHFFTPYLNHPLGIGFLLISSCLISQDEVY